MNRKRGITLIALVITIIVMLIIAGTGIHVAINTGNTFDKAEEAKMSANLATLEEEIEIYITGKQLLGKTGIDQYPVTEDTMESIDKSSIADYLKNKMVAWANTAEASEIPTIDTIDYSKFYKIDKEKIPSVESFSGDLYLVSVDNDYKVISIAGEKYKGEKINVLIPLDDIAKPKYITVANNTYKLYGDGTLKVIGELTTNSGASSEENNKLTGVQEFNLSEIAKETTMAIDKNIQTDDEIAKMFGVKKLYFSSGTAYVIDCNDDLWAWGDNSYNKLGQGNSYLVAEPTKILEGRTTGVTRRKSKKCMGRNSAYLCVGHK